LKRGNKGPKVSEEGEPQNRTSLQRSQGGKGREGKKRRNTKPKTEKEEKEYGKLEKTKQIQRKVGLSASNDPRNFLIGGKEENDKKI